MAGVKFSLRKICWNVDLTVEVPAPDEPVIDMMGCFADMSPPMRSAGAEKRTAVEQRRFEGEILAAIVGRVIADDALGFAARAQNDRHALLRTVRRDLENALPSGRGEPGRRGACSGRR